ncbi:crossover junction endonuclease EME1 isoform X1 [Sipha flava]|uniref:Crossover junction endonuclease EME1 isoform X1 n=1 Tax=Sipha flava TaxID=143950 RepID=A0A8B8GDX7_9HEMI|nr:crossover junction endonuclease EME1 isoform X1 [Sipha flava]
MDRDFYKTYAISDSDNDSVIILNPGTDQTNISLYKDCPTSPEEPEFFRQVIRRQKRKKSLSPILTLHCGKDASYSEKNLPTNENQDYSYRTKIPKSNINEPKNQKNDELYNRNIPKSDIYTTMSHENTIEILQPKQKKRLSKEEKEEKKKIEMARKNIKKKLADELKRLSPKECMKYITVHIDVNLQNQGYSEQIISEIQSTDVKYKIESNTSVSHSVTWSRQISDTNSEDESFMLLIWDFEFVKKLILSDQLIEKINFIKIYKSQLSIIIHCTTDELKKTRSKKNSQLSRSDMLKSLEQMLLSCSISFRFIENKNEISLAILYYTKSIAQKPFKLNKYKEEQDGCNWYASGHTKNCISVDKNGTGLSQLWRQMLSQFPLCTLEISEAISSVYTSPITLLKAYENCRSRLEGETLLQDIPVRRGFGPLASNRRIGPELSKKIYIFFTDNTGSTTLFQ